MPHFRWFGLLSALLLLAAGCRTVAPTVVAPPEPPALTQRGEWGVWELPDGAGYQAWFVQRATPERLYLTSSRLPKPPTLPQPPAETAATAAAPPAPTPATPATTATPPAAPVVPPPPAAAPWDQWLLWGSAGATQRVTLISERATGTLWRSYDHLTGKVEAVSGPAPVPQGRFLVGGSEMSAPGDVPRELRVPEPRLWLSLYGNKVAVKTPAVPSTVGQKIYLIGAYSALEKAGVQVNDILVRVSPWGYDAPLMADYQDLHQELGNRYLVGDLVTFEFLRPKGEDEYELLRESIRLPELPGWGQELRPEVRAYEKSWGAKPATALQQLQTAMAKRHGCEAQVADLMGRFSAIHDTGDAYRLGPVVAAIKYPFQLESLSRGFLDAIPGREQPQRLALQLTWLKDIFLLDLASVAPAPTIRDWRGSDLKGHLDFLEDIVNAAGAEHAQAFAALTQGELDFMRRQSQPYLQGFVDSKMMSYDRDRERQRGNVQLLSLAHKLDRAALLRQALLLAQATEAAFITSLRAQVDAYHAAQVAKNPKFRVGGRVTSRGSKHGQIIIAGSDDDRYFDLPGIAVLIDLGGNDYYGNAAGASLPGKVPSALVIDCAGDDLYESWEPFRQGAGYFGVGMLLDLAGRDTYTGVRYCQGTGFMGIGVLWDQGGDDQYQVIDYGQGVGQFGAGILLDDAGNNQFRAHVASQGVGLPWGVGLLHCSDPNGQDSYYNKGQHASGYGDAGSFEGWGQGVGFGHRHFASGGMGFLVDQGGNDRYDAGTFSQGGGYFYGLGILQDRGHGNDFYRGSRYNQGFTAHQASGVFLEEGGDDQYLTHHFVAMGLSWDQSTTLFVDRQGNDRYQAGAHAFGVASMNGATIFVDHDGNDSYRGPRPGENSGNQYHGGSSLALFVDLGGGSDEFGDKRQADTLAVDKDFSFFIDAPTLEEANKRLAAKGLLPPPAPPAK